MNLLRAPSWRMANLWLEARSAFSNAMHNLPHCATSSPVVCYLWLSPVGLFGYKFVNLSQKELSWRLSETFGLLLETFRMGLGNRKAGLAWGLCRCTGEMESSCVPPLCSAGQESSLEWKHPIDLAWAWANPLSRKEKDLRSQILWNVSHGHRRWHSHHLRTATRMREGKNPGQHISSTGRRHRNWESKKTQSSFTGPWWFPRRIHKNPEAYAIKTAETHRSLSGNMPPGEVTMNVLKVTAKYCASAFF